MKKKIFGIPMTLFVLGILFIGGASAALMGYLGTITANVNVVSPMQLKVSSTDSDWQNEPLDLGTRYGGVPITFYTREENLANVSITANVENLITNDGITCLDFASVVVDTRTPGTGYGGDGVDLINMSLCSQDDSNRVSFGFPNQPFTWEAGQIDINRIIVTFKTDANGTYTFTNRIVP